jgi:2-polyprenyl-6-methoxyphenol hydroxylase-like FAD-dependent oxidoreductase
VVLLGDSAHSVHPYGGQGINLALQDAVLLAEALDRALRKSTDRCSVLDEFESLRRPFVERFQSRQRQLLGPGTTAETLYLADFAHLALGQEELRPLLQATPATLLHSGSGARTQEGSS